MNRFAANHPEDWEERLDQLTDHADRDDDLDKFNEMREQRRAEEEKRAQHRFEDRRRQ